MVDQEMLSAIGDVLEQKMEEVLDRKLDEALDRKLDEKLDLKFEEKFKPVNSKLNQLDKRVSGLEGLMEKLDKRTFNLEVSMGKMQSDITCLKSDITCLKSDMTCLKSDMTCIKVVHLENNIIPRLNTIEQCYIDTSKRYQKETEKIEEIDSNVQVLNQIVRKHSEQLQRA